MLTSLDPHKISDFAKRFSNADPRVYEQFIRVLNQYVTEITVAVTEASPGDILNAQGRAQQARKFLQLFTELPK
jgi:hypothetical protein